MSIIKAVCGWCGKVVRDGIEPITHTICADCYLDFVRELHPEVEGEDLLVNEYREIKRLEGGLSDQVLPKGLPEA